MRKFCVIARDYEFHVPRSHDPNVPDASSIQAGIDSLKNQTFKDFSVVVCHDGPKSQTYEQEGIDFGDLDVHFINTTQHMGAWGHYSADLAMRYAYEKMLGEYFIQFNIDNAFYPEAFEVLSQAVDMAAIDDIGIIIFGILHWKAMQGRFFPGTPPKRLCIDAMQLVADREIWKNEGFWHSKVEIADGVIYEQMCERYDWASIDNCLGINY